MELVDSDAEAASCIAVLPRVLRRPSRPATARYSRDGFVPPHRVGWRADGAGTGCHMLRRRSLSQRRDRGGMARQATLAAAAAAVVVSAGARLTAAVIPPGGTPDIVTFEGGVAEGYRLNGTRYFLGVPFAADTGGANAWMPPQPRAPWIGTLDATALGAGCISTDHNPDTASNQSTDCLNVNIYAPAAPGVYAVMLFLYGGAFKARAWCLRLTGRL